MAIIHYRASKIQVAITPAELMIYKKWSLPFLKQRFNKQYLLNRSDVKGIEIGRSRSGELILYLITSKSFPSHRFNFGIQALGPPDLKNLKPGRDYSAVSIWTANLQENLKKTTLGDLVAAWEFFHLCMPELEMKTSTKTE